ncbi:MAG TPA: cohesin domain-containing protein [Saprospiraceae bacterium]|nr:cohesin domain-containing protein [Saprospiraceae bacterium]
MKSLSYIEGVKVKITEKRQSKSSSWVLPSPGSITPYAYCVCNEGEFIITPFKDDNPLNGVTTYDLVLISKHILSLEPLTTPYHIIAADANQSGSVTTFDIVELRKLILGTYTVLPNNTSWRFVPRDYEFPNASNPFQIPFPEVINAEIDNSGISYEWSVSTTSGVVSGQLETADFTGIKVGDVNCSAIPCGNSGADVCPSCATYPQRPSNPAQRYSLSVPGRSVKEREVVILPVYASGQEPVIAYQAGFRFDPAKFTFLSVSAGDLAGFTPDAINLNEVASGQFKVVWFSMDYDNNYLEPGKVLFYVALQAKSAVESAEWILKLDDTVMENLGYTPDNMELPMLARLAQAQTREESIQQTASIAVACKPNPASTIVHLDITKQTAGMTRVFVFGPYGVRMFYREIQSASGNFQVAIEEVAQWPAGIYTWQVQQGADILTGKFVKQ